MIEQHRRPRAPTAHDLQRVKAVGLVMVAMCFACQPTSGRAPASRSGGGPGTVGSGGTPVGGTGGGQGQAGGSTGATGGTMGGAAPGNVTPGGTGGGQAGSAGIDAPVSPTEVPARTDVTEAGTEAPVSVGACAKGVAPPATIGCWINSHAATPLERASFDDHVAVYFDKDVNAASAGWVQPFMSQALQYAKATYDPQSKYGPDCLYVFLHQGRFLGGTISNYFDAFSNFRNATDVGASGWERGTNIDFLSHELGHIVEGASNGTHESPAYAVWGDSKWAEFFQYDLYVALGLTADATRVFQKFTNAVDNFPQPNTHWFRDWFFPLWRDHGKAAVMAKYFRLLAQHFPKRLENGGRNPIFSRRMTLGEFVHFTSGAAGKDLAALATQAFGDTFLPQLTKARMDFPAVVY